MKKHLKVIIIAAAIVGVSLLVVFGGIQMALAHYDTGTATVFDVLAVNLGVKESVVVGQQGDCQYILVRKAWKPETLAKREGYPILRQMGSAYPFYNSDGDRLLIVGTDAWCPLFRVYSVQYIAKESR